MTNKSKAYAEEMITELKSHFESIPEHRGPQAVIPLKDATMSAYAMFSLKFPSLLEFEEERKESGVKESNLKSIFGIGQIPSDTQMRSIVDEIEPQEFKGIFPAILKWIQSRKLLKPYEFFNHKGSEYYLTSVDGTGFLARTRSTVTRVSRARVAKMKRLPITIKCSLPLLFTPI